MDQFSFNSQYNGVNYDPNLPTNESFTNQKNTNLSFGLGGTYGHKFSKMEVVVGTSIFNLNRPNQGFYGEKIKRDIRSSSFVKVDYQINQQLNILPSMNIQLQGKYKSFILGSNLKYTVTKTPLKYFAVYLGAWLRNKDASIFTLGADYQNWFFGLSYDLNISSLTPASNYRGGSEIAIRYIIKQYKPKKITHRICPDYI